MARGLQCGTPLQLCVDRHDHRACRHQDCGKRGREENPLCRPDTGAQREGDNIVAGGPPRGSTLGLSRLRSTLFGSYPWAIGPRVGTLICQLSFAGWFVRVGRNCSECEAVPPETKTSLIDTCQPVVRTVRPVGANGAVTARAPHTITRPRYSVSSNGPMALTIQS